MKKKNNKIIILIMLLIIYQTLMYLIAKTTSVEINFVGNYIDSKIPFIPQFIYPYISWYLMLFIVPYIFYKNNLKNFNNYFVTTFICITLVVFIYFYYPTTMNRADLVVSSISEYLVSVVYKLDTPVLNCFPSMHCIISFIFIYVSLTDKKFNLKCKLFIVIWAMLVILSTVFVKQHVLIDMISAFIISLFVFLVVKKVKYLKDFDVVNR